MILRVKLKKLTNTSSKKVIFISLMTSFILTSCQDAAPPNAPECLLPGEEVLEDVNSRTPASNPDQVAAPVECLVPEQDEDAKMEINERLFDFNDNKVTKMNKALVRLKLVLNSVEFKERVLAHQYEGEVVFQANQGLSNSEIYERIMLASESLTPGEDEVMDVDINLYYKNNGVVGYTYPDSKGFWVNDKFFTTYTLSEVAANVVHEWLHKVGFDHDFDRTARREFSVPYGVGTIVKELIQKM